MLSLSKLLLIALVVAGLYYAAKWLRRKSAARPVARSSAPRAVEMRKCAVCGVFVGEGDGPCDKPGCPIPQP